MNEYLYTFKGFFKKNPQKNHFNVLILAYKYLIKILPFLTLKIIEDSMQQNYTPSSYNLSRISINKLLLQLIIHNFSCTYVIIGINNV